MTTAAAGSPAPPRWFLLLPLLVAAVWWPWSPYWKSDDYLMLHHANELSRVLADFSGPLYGATDVWFFWRPLMTASFWLELKLAGGPSPMLSHMTNVLVHASSALLVALLWRRWIGTTRAFVAGLVWALMPSHEGAITWAVGRSDVHGTFWSLLALFLFCRRHEGRGTLWPSLAATTAALLTKEIAFVVPAAATLLAFFRERHAGRALRAAAPLWVALAIYLLARFVVLGRLGGYGDMPIELMPTITGFFHVVADLVVPLRWAGSCGDPALLFAAATPAALALLWHLAQRGDRARLAAATATFLVACLPMVPFFMAHANVHNLRYYSLPTVALAGVFALPRGWTLVPLALLAAWALPFAAAREAVHDADLRTRAQHETLLLAANGNEKEPLFVAGLPLAHESGLAVMFHFGADRLVTPPFAAEPRRVLPLRPVAFGAFSIGESERDFAALPAGSTWRFDAPEALARVTSASALPDLPITGDDHGVVDLTSPRLAAMEGAKKGERLVTGAARAQCYRVTIFTALGYFACLFPEHARDDEPNGAIDLLQFFAGELALGVPQDRARPTWAVYGPGLSFVMEGLAIPTTHDLAPEFPVLIEAGAMNGDRFTPTHRAQRMLTFRFDRGYPAWVRKALNR